MFAPLTGFPTKAFLVAVVLLCCYINLNPPNPPPEKEGLDQYKTVSTSKWESGRFNITGIVTKLLQFMTQLISVVEIISILRVATLHEGSSATVADLRITTTFVVGLVMVVVATWIRLEAYRCLGQNFIFHLAIRKDHKLTTHGIYSVVRHPGYTGVVLYLAGTFLCQFGPGSYWAEVVVPESKVVGYMGCALGAGLATALGGALVTKIGREERLLRKEFQEEWDTWVKRTKYRLVPGIF